MGRDVKHLLNWPEWLRKLVRSVLDSQAQCFNSGEFISVSGFVCFFSNLCIDVRACVCVCKCVHVHVCVLCTCVCLTCWLVHVGVVLKSTTSTAGSGRGLTVRPTSTSEQVVFQKSDHWSHDFKRIPLLTGAMKQTTLRSTTVIKDVPSFILMFDAMLDFYFLFFFFLI